MYFSWFKKYNHLYKDIFLDTTLVDSFKDESMAASKDFERLTRKDEESDSDNESENEHDVECIDDLSTNINIDFATQEAFEPSTQFESGPTHDQTTMFFNKYCEDTNIPSVANRLAETIVEYETHHEIPFNYIDDDLIDDEIITEEEFLRNIDQELDSETQAGSTQDMDIEENLEDISLTHKDVVDEIGDQIDILFNPSEQQSSLIADMAKKQAKSALRKMEKICVAPGEFGNFKNWNDDMFLEEKCFPEKFPYGTGGYLSSMINDGDVNMG